MIVGVGGLAETTELGFAPIYQSKELGLQRSCQRICKLVFVYVYQTIQGRVSLYTCVFWFFLRRSLCLQRDYKSETLETFLRRIGFVRHNILEDPYPIQFLCIVDKVQTWNRI